MDLRHQRSNIGKLWRGRARDHRRPDRRHGRHCCRGYRCFRRFGRSIDSQIQICRDVSNVFRFHEQLLFRENQQQGVVTNRVDQPGNSSDQR